MLSQVAVETLNMSFSVDGRPGCKLTSQENRSSLIRLTIACGSSCKGVLIGAKSIVYRAKGSVWVSPMISIPES
jgi:hypothetical protein